MIKYIENAKFTEVINMLDEYGEDTRFAFNCKTFDDCHECTVKILDSCLVEHGGSGASKRIYKSINGCENAWLYPFIKHGSLEYYGSKRDLRNINNVVIVDYYSLIFDTPTMEPPSQDDFERFIFS